MIKEADERQPSVELAQALAATLQLPPEQHPFLQKLPVANGRQLLHPL